MALQIRRGTEAERLTITPAEGELIYTTDTRLIYVGDGSTIGGTKADSGITDLLSDSTPQLGGNLDLNSQTITGTGTINITGNITGSTVSGSSGNFTSSVIGSLQAASVQGDLTGSVFANDSTMLVDGTDGKLVLSNNVIQDLSNVYIPTTPTGGDAIIWNAVDSRWEAGNVSVSAGVFDGDMQGSVFGDDSTLIVDGVNNTVTANSITTFNIIPQSTGGVLVDNNIPGQVTRFGIESEGASPVHNLTRFEPLLDLSLTQTNTPLFYDFEKREFVGANPGTVVGAINFETIDTNGTNIYGGYIRGQNDGLYLGHSLDGIVDGTKTLRLVNGYVTIGATNAIEMLTVGGNAFFNGFITAGTFRGNVDYADSTTAVNYLTGLMTSTGMYCSGTVRANQLAGDVIGTDSTVIVNFTDSTVTSGGFIQFGSYNTTERNALTAANGMIIYNSQVNRFQGYQNGAWINIDDGTAA